VYTAKKYSDQLLMKNHSTSSYFAEGYQRKILGIRERTVYRLGVFIFYILLFLAVSVISSNMQLPKSKSEAGQKK
jgi:hypothetical protein